MGVGGQPHAPAASTHGKDPVAIIQEAGWAPGPVWIGAENLTPTGVRSPDRPARSQSLYQLCYPAHKLKGNYVNVLRGDPLNNLTNFGTRNPAVGNDTLLRM